MISTICRHDARQTCTSCRFDRVVRKAYEMGREPTFEELNNVLRMAIARTDYYEAQLVLNVFDRDLDESELESMVSMQISSGNIELAHHAARRAGRVLSENEWNTLVYNGMVIQNNIAGAIEAVNAGRVSTQGIRKLIHVCLLKALPRTANMLADHIEYKFSESEIQTIESSCLKLGHVCRLTDVYQLPTLHFL